MALLIKIISLGTFLSHLFRAKPIVPIHASLAAARSLCPCLHVPLHVAWPQGRNTLQLHVPALFRRDGRLTPGDELLMINGQSLVGLSHQDAVALLRSAAGLVQLVVASKVQSSPW